MKKAALPFERIVFICVNKRDNGEACCADRSSQQILDKLKECVKDLGLSGKIRVSKSGCQDVCARGPSIMVFPDNIWYHEVSPNDIDEIVRAIIQGIHPRPENSTKV